MDSKPVQLVKQWRAATNRPRMKPAKGYFGNAPGLGLGGMYIGAYVGLVRFPPWFRGLTQPSSDPHWVALQGPSEMPTAEMLGLGIMFAVAFGLLGLAALVRWGLWSIALPRLMPALIQQVRRNCLDHGLLLLALEHQPHDRLRIVQPAARHWAETLGLRSRRRLDAGAMEERLEWVRERYVRMCKALRLKPFPAGTDWLLATARTVQTLIVLLGLGAWSWWLFGTPTGRAVLDSQQGYYALGTIFGGVLFWMADLLPKLVVDMVDLAVRSVLGLELEPTQPDAATPDCELSVPSGYDYALYSSPPPVATADQ